MRQAQQLNDLDSCAKSTAKLTCWSGVGAGKAVVLSNAKLAVNSTLNRVCQPQQHLKQSKTRSQSCFAWPQQSEQEQFVAEAYHACIDKSADHRRLTWHEQQTTGRQSNSDTGDLLICLCKHLIVSGSSSSWSSPQCCLQPWLPLKQHNWSPALLHLPSTRLPFQRHILSQCSGLPRRCATNTGHTQALGQRCPTYPFQDDPG